MDISAEQASSLDGSCRACSAARVLLAVKAGAYCV
jgi:hypothetical protein